MLIEVGRWIIDDSGPQLLTLGTREPIVQPVDE